MTWLPLCCVANNCRLDQRFGVNIINRERPRFIAPVIALSHLRVVDNKRELQL